jgi:hypothetical protein
MNVEIGAEAAQFPEKEYINGIAFAVHALLLCPTCGIQPFWLTDNWQSQILTHGSAWFTDIFFCIY